MAKGKCGLGYKNPGLFRAVRSILLEMFFTPKRSIYNGIYSIKLWG